MKKTLNIYHRIVQETDEGFFLIYHLDIKEGTYEEIMRLDIKFLSLDGDPAHEFFSACEMFHNMKSSLERGVYFCVYRDSRGSEWFTEDTRDPSVKNPVLADSKK